jgi:hypothetical protein
MRQNTNAAHSFFPHLFRVVIPARACTLSIPVSFFHSEIPDGKIQVTFRRTSIP